MSRLAAVAVSAEMKRAARQEMAAPTMAFDVISMDGDPGDRVNTGKNHPLAWILEAPLAAEPEPPAFFDELGQRVRQELIRPSGRFAGSLETRRNLAPLVGLAQDEVACPTDHAPPTPTIKLHWPRAAGKTSATRTTTRTAAR